MSTWTAFFILVSLYLLYRLIFPKKTQIIRFYRPDCRFCVESQKEWDSFKALAAAEKLDIEILDVNISSSSRDTKNLVKHYGVKTVPYVVKTTTFGSKTYNGPRVSSSYLEFVK
jgi:glutaredoxin